MYKFAGVVVNNESLQVDKIFTYGIPDKMSEVISVGHWVKVPFGKGNKLIDGFVLKLFEEYDGDLRFLKNISALSQPDPLLTDHDVKLVDFMRNKYLCSYIDCIKAIIPTGIISGLKAKVSENLFIGKALEGKHKKETYMAIYEAVLKENGVYSRAALIKKFGFSASSINTLIKYGFLSTGEIVVNRYNSREYEKYAKKELNIEQKKAVNTILESDRKTFLIHGVTGSGKTEVYMNVLSSLLEREKQSIILVPEISLTPQMVERFKGRFGKDITVFHSKLSEGERYDEWNRVKSGNVKVAIGARSAVFLPFNNLGLIVIDEEHESSYKSDSNPKYDAREVAEFKCMEYGAKLVLGSATPSIETYFKAVSQEMGLITLDKRADNANMPAVQVIDMREELASNNKSIFSRKLYASMVEAIGKNEQIILFLNRRGFSTFVSCRKCGFVFKCKNCDISMTFHIDGNYLSCHYCGSRHRVSSTCPKCGSNYVKYFGTGTEKVETEIKKLFPQVKTLRMDLDTTRKKNSYEDMYNSFKNREAQILIGTQMIAKGLDFPEVTLVGVLAADLSLNLPDYKASERTFQLLTQVSGRAGRGRKAGNVIIQTYNPEHYSIGCSVTSNYNEFFDRELNLRRDMHYPPFSKILCINLSSKNESLLIKTSQDIGIDLKEKIKFFKEVDVLGPCPCSISKIKEMYRWQIIVKGNFELDFAHRVKDFVYEWTKEIYNDVKVSIDINPSSLL